MTNYIDPIGDANPFLTTSPLVIIVRHVRVTAANETVVEAPTTIQRHSVRADLHRVFPRSMNGAPPERNIPEHGAKKKAY